MKIFKNTSLTDEIMQTVAVGETVITKGNREHEKTGGYPYAHFFVLLHTSPGAFPYQGGFNNLKNAVKFAESIERPDLVNNYYQIIDLAGGQKIVLYYNGHDDDVVKYIDAIDYISSEPVGVGKSGMSARFIHPEVSMMEQMAKDAINAKRSDFALFGQYMMSDERRQRMANHPEVGDKHLEQRLKVVHDSDFDWYQDYVSKFYGKESDKPAESLVEELDTIEKFKAMCEQSLSPEGFDKFDSVLGELFLNRKGLKEN